MIKEGIINYKLYINEDGADGVAFDNTIEAGLTALLITAESLHQMNNPYKIVRKINLNKILQVCNGTRKTINLRPYQLRLAE